MDTFVRGTHLYLGDIKEKTRIIGVVIEPDWRSPRMAVIVGYDETKNRFYYVYIDDSIQMKKWDLSSIGLVDICNLQRSDLQDRIEWRRLAVVYPAIKQIPDFE